MEIGEWCLGNVDIALTLQVNAALSAQYDRQKFCVGEINKFCLLKLQKIPKIFVKHGYSNIFIYF